MIATPEVASCYKRAPARQSSGPTLSWWPALNTLFSLCGMLSRRVATMIPELELRSCSPALILHDVGKLEELA